MTMTMMMMITTTTTKIINLWSIKCDTSLESQDWGHLEYDDDDSDNDGDDDDDDNNHKNHKSL